MDDRIRKRRRSVRWQRGRGRRTLLLLVGLLLCSTAAFLWLRSTDVFDVQRVTASGAERVTREQLVAATSSTMGESLLSLSTVSIKEALLALPYVESVSVIRAFPNTLEIRVKEHRPVARLQTASGESWVVSEEGKVLEDTEPGLLPGLPLVVSEMAASVSTDRGLPQTLASVLPLAECLESGEMLDRLPPVSSVAVSAAGCASLVLEDGGELRLGTPGDWLEKLQVAVEVVERCMSEGRDIEYVDVSVIDRVAVKAK